MNAMHPRRFRPPADYVEVEFTRIISLMSVESLDRLYAIVEELQDDGRDADVVAIARELYEQDWARLKERSPKIPDDLKPLHRRRLPVLGLGSRMTSTMPCACATRRLPVPSPQEAGRCHADLARRMPLTPSRARDPHPKRGDQRDLARKRMFATAQVSG